MIEEMAQTYTSRQLEHIRNAYESEVDLFGGEVPAIGETDTILFAIDHALLNIC